MTESLKTNRLVQRLLKRIEELEVQLGIKEKTAKERPPKNKPKVLRELSRFHRKDSISGSDT